MAASEPRIPQPTPSTSTARLLPDGTIEIRTQPPGGAPASLSHIQPQDAGYRHLLRTLDLPPATHAVPGTESSAAPAQVGVATMLDGGALQLQLRSEEPDGTIAEALLTVFPQEARYASMLAHLGALKPGQSCPIRPFPDA